MRRCFVWMSSVALLLAAGTGARAEDRYIPRPPILLSPDLVDPGWFDDRPEYDDALIPPYQRNRYWHRRAAPDEPRAVVRSSRQIDPAFLPTVVVYDGSERPGTIIIDTEARYLYLVQRDGSARRYGVGVGKPGFEWAGMHKVTRKAEWPGWTPPGEMLQRRPELPSHMEGGPNNPLGARAIYLGSTLYRIHGSNEPWSIGHAVSSGCIRMRNQDVIDLYGRVGIGTIVIVR
jgi:lipoprotein-anchoring transpeptidase ErfK/SrfK